MSVSGKAVKPGARGNSHPKASAPLVVADVPYVPFKRRPIVNGAYVNDGDKVLYLPYYVYVYMCIIIMCMYIYIYEFTYITSINVARV